MKKARLIVLMIALVAAGLTAVLISSFLERPAPTKIMVKEKSNLRVLVAKADIKLGETVKVHQLIWQPWPDDAIVTNYIADRTGQKSMSEVVGMLARGAFVAGEPIVMTKLLKTSSGGVLAAILKKGMRAVAIGIKDETAAGWFVLPNDRVDVILTVKLRSRGGRGGDQHVAQTLLTNVQVLAVGQSKTKTKEGEDTLDGNTATLAVTAAQAQVLAQARNMGELSLSLRSLADSKPSDGKPGQQVDLGEKPRGSIRVLRYGINSRNYTVR